MALTTTRTVPAEQPLYDKDPYSWALEQARALRERRTERLDWDNLAEEVEDLARRDADALRSHFESLIEHLLEQGYAPAAAKRDNLGLWQLSIRNSSNPGLKSRSVELFTQAWPYARDAALGALNLDDEKIPEHSVWTFDQVMKDDFEVAVRSRPNRRS